MRKAHFCYLKNRRFYQMEAHVFKNFFLRWDLTFPVRKGIKLLISAKDWRVVVAWFSKTRYICKILFTAWYTVVTQGLPIPKPSDDACLHWEHVTVKIWDVPSSIRWLVLCNRLYVFDATLFLESFPFHWSVVETSGREEKGRYPENEVEELRPPRTSTRSAYHLSEKSGNFGLKLNWKV